MVSGQLKEKYKEVTHFFKDNIWAILLSAFFIFAVIWAGNTISVITSREILEPLSVKIEGFDGQEMSSIKVLAILSRAGNTVNLVRVPEHQDEWNNFGQAFIKKIVLGLKDEHLDKLKQITISLGDNSYVFNKERFLAEWKKIDNQDEDFSLKSNLYDEDGNNIYLVYQAPDNIKAEPLDIPFVPSIFSSINFGGSGKLIQQPLISGLKLFFLVEIMIFIFFLILSLFQKKNNDIADEGDAGLHKRKFIIFGLSMTVTLFLLFLFNILLAHFYKPDTAQLLAGASEVYRDFILSSFVPKPAERMQFVFSILLSPVLLFISYKLLSRYIAKLNGNIISRLYYFLSIIFPLIIFALAYVGLAVSNFLYINNSYSFGGIGKYIYGILLFPIGAYLIYSLKMEKNKIIKILFYLFSGLLLAIIFFINIFALNNAILVTKLSFAPHFNPVFYPMAQVVAGKTMLVDLTGQYGLSPVFLSEVFKLVDFNILSFTSLMGFLLVLSYLFIFIFLRRLIKSNVILLIGFSTVIFYFFNNGSNPSPYFQYWPIRIFFPCLALLLVSFYVKNKNKLLYFIISIISALSILWNTDSGVVVFVSWIAALCYSELFAANKKTAVKKIIFHLLFGLLIFGLVLSVYTVYSFLRSGFLPDFSILWLFQKTFLLGFMLIPMPFPHVWLLAAIAFLAGLLVAIRGWCNKDNSYKNILIFFLSIMGIGLFSYYEGRSHDYTFFGPLFIALVLLPVLADYLFRDSLSNRKLYGSGILCLMILFFIFSSPINLIATGGKYYNWTKAGLNAFTDKTETVLTRNVDFIKKYTEKGEEIIILSEQSVDGLYYGESGTRSALNLPSSTEVLLKKEVDYLFDFLRCNRGYKLFFYPYESREKDMPDKYYFYDARIVKILRDDYVVVNKSGDDMILLARKNNIPDNCGVQKLIYQYE